MASWIQSQKHAHTHTHTQPQLHPSTTYKLFCRFTPTRSAAVFSEIVGKEEKQPEKEEEGGDEWAEDSVRALGGDIPAKRIEGRLAF